MISFSSKSNVYRQQFHIAVLLLDRRMFQGRLLKGNRLKIVSLVLRKCQLSYLVRYRTWSAWIQTWNFRTKLLIFASSTLTTRLSWHLKLKPLCKLDIFSLLRIKYGHRKKRTSRANNVHSFYSNSFQVREWKGNLLMKFFRD